jgi:superfamily I DNA/RNA helicase
MNWSEQQAAFLSWCRTGTGSCVLEAVAGAGKTTVLLEAAKIIRGQVAMMAYNKKIAEELKTKLVKLGIDWKKAQAGTVHSFGFSAYRKARPNVKVAEHKVANIVECMLLPAHPLAVWSEAVVTLVSLAKQRALGVVGSMDSFDEWADIAQHFDVFDEDDGPAPLAEIVPLCIKVLRSSNEALDVIDFDDMVYMPLVHRVRFWQFDVVMVDEAQDTNPARRALVRALLKKGGRVIAVGDRHQAIYGFTGADADSLDLIAKDFSCVRLPLTITYRCPKAVVAFAHQWVSHIEAAPSAPEGSVAKSTMDAFLKRNDLVAGSAVLSRVTKPLVALALTLIRHRVACRVEGRDVAAGIKKLMTRWKVSSLDALETKLESYLARETTKLLAKKQEARLQTVEDTVETVRVIIEQCRAEKKSTVADAVAYVDSLFADNVSDVLVLSTIHKSKGREWGRVFWLDRANTCPSKWARQEWQVEQERNICYVAATRAQEELIELDAATIRRAA